MYKNSKIYVAGHNGLVGSAITRRLKADGYHRVIVRTHKELDLINQAEVNSFFKIEKPDYVFLSAAKVGGIGANSSSPAEFIYQNMLIGFNTVHAAYKNGVKKLLNLGSSCIYPKLAPQPLKEEALLTGLLETTNEAYAIAKISTIKLCSAYNTQYNTNYLSLMPTNLYGPEDNFSLNESHVLPAMIRKFHEAKITGKDEVVLWGDGSPYREFLYSADLADAAIYFMCNKNAKDIGDFINIGCGIDLSIKELAEKIKTLVYSDTNGRSCKIIWDKTKPNGTPKKLLDITRALNHGWSPSTSLEIGLEKVYNQYKLQ